MPPLNHKLYTCGSRLLFVCLVITPLLLTGCRTDVIEGVVSDINGEKLPGVVVSIKGSQRQTLTNALGQYTLSFSPGQLELEFHKTGYTPGQLALDVAEQRRVQAAEMRLWRLPPNMGVYIYDENHKYIPLRPVEAETLATKERGVIRVIAKYDPGHTASVRLQPGKPTILGLHMPHDAVKLNRIEKSELTAEKQGVEIKQFAWVASLPIPVGMEALDPPEGAFQHLKLFAPLEPGHYAFHWGALDNDTAPDKRAFLLTILEPGAPPPEPEMEPEEPPAPPPPRTEALPDGVEGDGY